MRLTAGVKAMEEHSRLAAEAIEKGGFDILFANTCESYHAPFIGRYVNIPSLLYLQEPNRFLYEALPGLPWLGAPEGASWRRKLRAKFDMVALRKLAIAELENAKTYRRILVNSYFSRESVVRAYGLDSSVCYLGVDTDKFSPSGLNREPFVLGIGAVATPKRVDLAIEAMALLPDPKPKLVWAGNFADAVYLESIKQLAKDRGVNLEFHALVSDEELLRLIRTTQCLVYVPRLEPFGYVPVEAAACGTPVVTVREGGLRESMDGIGVLVDGTPSAIAQGITQVLAEPQRFADATLGHREEIVSKWGLSTAIDCLEAHLIEVASSNR